MSELESRICHWCKAQVSAESFCPECTDHFKARPPARMLTPDGREREMRSLDGPLEVPFEMIHERIEELVGRPVWTHEMGLNWEGICREARWETEGATMQDVLDLIPEYQRIDVEVTP